MCLNRVFINQNRVTINPNILTVIKFVFSEIQEYDPLHNYR